jgi:hypothetical protein
LLQFLEALANFRESNQHAVSQEEYEWQSVEVFIYNIDPVSAKRSDGVRYNQEKSIYGLQMAGNKSYSQ